MIEVIEGFPKGVGIVVRGRVTKEDCLYVLEAGQSKKKVAQSTIRSTVL